EALSELRKNIETANKGLKGACVAVWAMHWVTELGSILVLVKCALNKNQIFGWDLNLEHNE
ncbi:hypothetical protein BGZ58_006897, partial [Dissophora ornata]